MKKVTGLVREATTTGAGQWVQTNGDKRTFQVTIAGTASVSIEGSNDGVNAVTLKSGITASGGYVDDAPWAYVRANVVSETDGTVTVTMGENEQ